MLQIIVESENRPLLFIIFMLYLVYEFYLSQIVSIFLLPVGGHFAGLRFVLVLLSPHSFLGCCSPSLLTLTVMLKVAVFFVY